MQKDTPTLLSVRDFCARHEWARPGGLRLLLANRRDNGFGACVVRLGRRVLLDEQRVYQWLEQRREVASTQ